MDTIPEKKTNLLNINPYLVLQRKEVNDFSNLDTLNTYSTRASNEYMLFLKELMPNVNTFEINEHIYKSTKTLFSQLNIKLNNKEIMDFTFILNAIISLKKSDTTLKISKTMIENEKYRKLANDYISRTDIINSYTFTEEDLYIISQMIMKYDRK